MYEPLNIETGDKCKSVIAEPKELTRIVKGKKRKTHERPKKEKKAELEPSKRLDK
jgi:hypothetical protein